MPWLRLSGSHLRGCEVSVVVRRECAGGGYEKRVKNAENGRRRAADQVSLSCGTFAAVCAARTLYDRKVRRVVSEMPMAIVALIRMVVKRSICVTSSTLLVLLKVTVCRRFTKRNFRDAPSHKCAHLLSCARRSVDGPVRLCVFQKPCLGRGVHDHRNRSRSIRCCLGSTVASRPLDRFMAGMTRSQCTDPDITAQETLRSR